jgi:hypothetical protein
VAYVAATARVRRIRTLVGQNFAAEKVHAPGSGGPPGGRPVIPHVRRWALCKVGDKIWGCWLPASEVRVPQSRLLGALTQVSRRYFLWCGRQERQEGRADPRASLRI